MALQESDRRVIEGATAAYQATILNEAGSAIPAADVSSITLTLYDKASGAIINGRERQDILNDNGVTIDSAGLLTWTIDPADNVIISDSLETGQYERHVALFEWTYNGGLKAGKYELELLVRQLKRVQ